MRRTVFGAVCYVTDDNATLFKIFFPPKTLIFKYPDSYFSPSRPLGRLQDAAAAVAQVLS